MAPPLGARRLGRQDNDTRQPREKWIMNQTEIAAELRVLAELGPPTWPSRVRLLADAVEALTVVEPIAGSEAFRAIVTLLRESGPTTYGEIARRVEIPDLVGVVNQMFDTGYLTIDRETLLYRLTDLTTGGKSATAAHRA